MALQPRHRRINPIARAPILRKGGAHVKSRSGERQQYKQQLKQKLLKEEAGEDDFSGFFDACRKCDFCRRWLNTVFCLQECERHHARLFNIITAFFVRTAD